jgi:outer membrane protein assembly factor BamB
VDKLCIVQYGSRGSGGIAAYELSGGKEKWKWPGDAPAYASPALFTLGDLKAIIAETAGKIVAVNAADGKLLWQTSYKTRYNASSPFVDGQTVLFAGNGGKGTKAVKLEKKDGGLEAKDLWSNNNNVIYNTPVASKGLVYGISERNSLFCINEKDGKTAWTASLSGGGGGRGRGGYGSVVAADSVLFALTPAGTLVVFQGSDKEFKKLASYSVGKQTFAYPVIAGNRIFIKDSNSLTLYTIE